MAKKKQRKVKNKPKTNQIKEIKTMGKLSQFSYLLGLNGDDLNSSKQERNDYFLFELIIFIL